MMFLAGGSVDLLSVNPGLIIWTTVTFLVVLIVLWKFAWRPITTALDQRNQRVEDDLSQSKVLREKAESLLSEYEKKMELARQEAIQLLEEGKKDAEANKTRILAEARAEADRIKERTTYELEQAKLKAISEIESKVIDLSVVVLEKVMKNQISSGDHKELIRKEIGSLH